MSGQRVLESRAARLFAGVAGGGDARSGGDALPRPEYFNLEAVRAALATGGVRSAAGYALRDLMCRSEAQAMELNYVRAHLCCTLQWQAPHLNRSGKNLIDRSLPFFTTARHPLLPKALAVATALAIYGHDLAAALQHGQAAFQLTSSQFPEWVHDPAINLAYLAVQTGDTRLAADAVPILLKWLAHPEVGIGPTAGRLATTLAIAEWAAMSGDFNLACQSADRAEALAAGVDLQRAARPDHDCDQLGQAIIAQARTVALLAQLRLDSACLIRLRALHGAVSSVAHLCAGVDFDLWLNLADAALTYGSRSAAPFARAASNALHQLKIPTPWDVRRLHGVIMRLTALHPRTVSGEVSDLLQPAAWTCFPYHPVERTAAPAVSLLLVN